ncbi:4527_t:CDS:2 [Ambispora gerdemannii]|uniref:4527_t:CDS:1 n=1 Tax=Ambispora gerdemannii TaxID=144530 RepID=A0A9N8YZ13_9GLOM|nr:4527_t:CDS:2 [Ambispora gerdemannii]
MKIYTKPSVPVLPVELILEIFKYIPTRNLCRFMVLSRTFDTEIKKIIVKRFNETFWNKHRRLLVFLTRYILDLVPAHNGFDLTLDKLDNKDLIATFIVDLSQPKGTIGPNHTSIWGLKLRGDGVVRNPLNEPIWTLPADRKEARIYLFDSDTDRDHPLIRAFYVTKGNLRASDDTIIDCVNCDNNPFEKTVVNNNDNDDTDNDTSNSNNDTKIKLSNMDNAEGWWKHDLIGRKHHKAFRARAHLICKNESRYQNEMLREVRVSASMLLVAADEKRKDRGVGGVKFLVVEGGQSSFRRRGCVIS